jgi:hypothetical protein
MDLELKLELRFLKKEEERIGGLIGNQPLVACQFWLARTKPKLGLIFKLN